MTHNSIAVGTPLSEGSVHLLFYPVYDASNPNRLLDQQKINLTLRDGTKISILFFKSVNKDIDSMYKNLEAIF